MPLELLPPFPSAAPSALPSALPSASLRRSPSARPSVADDRVVDLPARRRAAEAALRAAADAEVRHLTAEFLDALQGSWGTPQELLGSRRGPVRLAVAR